MNQNLQYAIEWVKAQSNGASEYHSMERDERVTRFGGMLPGDHPTHPNWWVGSYFAKQVFAGLYPEENFDQIHALGLNQALQEKLLEKVLRVLKILQKETK